MSVELACKKLMGCGFWRLHPLTKTLTPELKAVKVMAILMISKTGNFNLKNFKQKWYNYEHAQGAMQAGENGKFASGIEETENDDYKSA